MRAVVQRVKSAKVEVDGNLIGKIDQGILLLLGIKDTDKDEDLSYILKKVTGLRIFDDENGVMNKSIIDTKGQLLVVSQFTLYGDARKGNRPSYQNAAGFEDGKYYYKKSIEGAKNKNIYTQEGEYGADLKVTLINDGPVTILLDSEKTF